MKPSRQELQARAREQEQRELADDVGVCPLDGLCQECLGAIVAEEEGCPNCGGWVDSLGLCVNDCAVDDPWDHDERDYDYFYDPFPGEAV